jgi:D-tyrosyl-tRNA(Tyr) deacylase
MRALLQRVTHARVDVGDATVGEIGNGLLVFVGVYAADGAQDIAWLVEKLLNLRAFSDAAGKMNCSVRDIGGGVLAVSQFTLAADLRRGRRPSFDSAAPPAQARQIYEQFVAVLRAAHPQVASGTFGADMRVHLVNDGPVTFLVDTPPRVTPEGRTSP